MSEVAIHCLPYQSYAANMFNTKTASNQINRGKQSFHRLITQANTIVK